MMNIKIVPAFLILLSFLASVAFGQTEEKSPTAKFLYKRGYTYPGEKRKDASRLSKWPDTLYYNTTYRSKLLGSPTIPITFSRVEEIDGKYQVTPTIGIGLGYTCFFGDFIFSENDRMIVVPTFFFGLVADIGVQSDFNLFKPAGFFTGGFIGTSALSFFFGYGFVTKSPTIGLGTRIDLYTLSQKSLRPIGKVRALRRHKKKVTPIIDEWTRESFKLQASGSFGCEVACGFAANRRHRIRHGEWFNLLGPDTRTNPSPQTSSPYNKVSGSCRPLTSLKRPWAWSDLLSPNRWDMPGAYKMTSRW